MSSSLSSAKLLLTLSTRASLRLTLTAFALCNPRMATLHIFPLLKDKHSVFTFQIFNNISPYYPLLISVNHVSLLFLSCLFLVHMQIIIQVTVARICFTCLSSFQEGVILQGSKYFSVIFLFILYWHMKTLHGILFSSSKHELKLKKVKKQITIEDINGQKSYKI